MRDPFVEETSGSLAWLVTDIVRLDVPGRRPEYRAFIRAGNLAATKNVRGSYFERNGIVDRVEILVLLPKKQIHGVKPGDEGKIRQIAGDRTSFHRLWKLILRNYPIARIEDRDAEAVLNTDLKIWRTGWPPQ